MSNIEDFPGRDELSPKEKLRKQFFKRLRARIYTVLFIVVVVVAVVVSYFTYERTKVYTGTEILESVVFDVSSGARIESFAGGIMTYSKDGAQAILELPIAVSLVYERMFPTPGLPRSECRRRVWRWLSTT